MARAARRLLTLSLILVAGAAAPAFSQAFPGCSAWDMTISRPAGATPIIDWYVAGVARGDGLFVALVFDRARGSLVLVSKDGKTWDEGRVLAGPERLPHMITYGGGRFVAFVGCDQVFVSTDGEHWQGGTIGGCAEMSRVIWTGTEFLAVGGIGGTVIGSADGLNWTLRYHGPPPYWVDAQPAGYRPLEALAWSGKRFVASGFLHLVVSTDGDSWVAAEPPQQTGYDDIVWTGSEFVAVAGGSVITSNDGLTWESHAVEGTDGVFSPLLWSGEELVARNGTCLYRSSDGIAWTADECLPQENGNDFTYLVDLGNVQFAVSNAGLYRRACSGRTLLLPGAAHTIGVGGSEWRTDLDLLAIGNTLTTVHVGLHPWRTEGSAVAEKTLTLPPGRSLHLDDVLWSLFGREGAATLTLTPVGGAITAQARTYAESPGGTYGQFIRAVPEDAAASTGDEVWLVGLKQAASDQEGYRSDLGLVNPSDLPVDLTVTVFNPQRTELGTRTYHLRPKESLQVTKVLTRVTMDEVPEAIARITTKTPNGRFLVYASVIDNRSNDPVYITGTERKAQPRK